METNRIIVGDCVEEMGKLPAGSVKCIVTSPPYNVGVGKMGGEYGHYQNGVKRRTKLKVRGIEYANHDDRMPDADYIAWQRTCLASMMRVLRQDGVIFYNHKKRPIVEKYWVNYEILRGLPVRQEIVWDRRCGFSFTPTYFLPTYETIYMICKPDFRLRVGANKMKDVWQILPERNNPHPAPFPVEIPMRCIMASIASVDQEAVVLDPFLGSGTTALAADRLGVKWLGIEKSEEYAERALGRIEGDKVQTRLAI